MKPIEVIINNEQDKRAFCNPSRIDIKIIKCRYFDCEYSEVCRFAKEKVKDDYSKLIEVVK